MVNFSIFNEYFNFDFQKIKVFSLTLIQEQGGCIEAKIKNSDFRRTIDGLGGFFNDPIKVGNELFQPPCTFRHICHKEVQKI